MVVSIDKLLLLGDLFVSDTGLFWDDLVIQKSVEYRSLGMEGGRSWEAWEMRCLTCLQRAIPAILGRS